MELGQLIFIVSRLLLGTAVSFLAIMIWPRARDAAWILVIISAITSYVEIIYYILNYFGITGDSFITVGSMPILSILLPNLQTAFLIAAFAVMAARKYRYR